MATFLEELKKKLTPEQYLQITDALGDDFNFDLVPRSRLNKVIEERNALRVQFSSTQSEAQPLKEEKKEATPEEILKSLELKHKEELRRLALEYALTDSLRVAGAVDPSLIIKAGLIPTDKITGDPGAFKGIEEAIKGLTEDKSKAYLFQQQQTAAGTGKAGETVDSSEVTVEQFRAMSFSDMVALKEKSPEVYKKLAATPPPAMSFVPPVVAK
jgi:hypothetical protein